MKRFFALALAACLLAGCFAGCGNAASSAPTRPETLPDYNPNPLTGMEKDAGYPYGQRPVAVMINNIKESLPQSGIASADLMYEMVTEGGITRMMAVYSDLSKAGGAIGPVRSARDQHIQMILPMQALYVHIGSSTFARDMLETYHYAERDLDGNSTTVRDTAFRLDEERHATRDIEHCWYTSSEMISAGIKKYKLSTEGETSPVFKFGNYSSAPRMLLLSGAKELHISFSQSDYSDFSYDSASGKYLKSEFGAPQLDAATGEQLRYNNLLILFTDITPRPDGVLMNVNYNFGGVGYYVNGGNYEPIRWLKGTPEQPLRIISMEDDEVDIEINPGTSYIAMVGLD
ncbi:MAG: DUF3048 domain-containing protein, partial [Pygmaiobacter sp.]